MPYILYGVILSQSVIYILFSQIYGAMNVLSFIQEDVPQVVNKDKVKLIRVGKTIIVEGN